LILVLSTVAGRAPADLPAPPQQPASATRDAVPLIAPTPAAPNAGVAGPQEPPRDPTAPSPLLRELLKPAGKQSKMAVLPLIRITGRMIGGLQPNAALLQIGPDDQRPASPNAAGKPGIAALQHTGNRSYLVRKGTELLIPGAGSDTQTIRVLDVTADEVRIEIAPLGRVLTLN
jgi:hypothetical protein